MGVSAFTRQLTALYHLLKLGQISKKGYYYYFHTHYLSIPLFFSFFSFFYFLFTYIIFRNGDGNENDEGKGTLFKGTYHDYFLNFY